MYKIIKHTNHLNYGKTIEIVKDNSMPMITPFQVANKALQMKRLWKEKTKYKIKLLVAGRILTDSQLESWSIEEYKLLPKCEECGKILADQIYTHRLSDHFFCTQLCADRNYDFILEKMNDNEESEFDL